jgi:hypothetical protein
LALVWALAPAIPALLRGELLGHGFTDLYPSVWGLHWFVNQQPGLPTWCHQLAAPNGMAFAYSSPLHGWAAWPFLQVLGLTMTWNLTVIAARVATVLVAWWAARAWGLAGTGALVAAAVYGASPFFQGYSVEGIVEGTDGWALALWLGAVANRRPLLCIVGFALTVASSWYMAALACVLAVCLGPWAWATAAAGLALASPLVWGFLGAFPQGEALDPAVRAAMGAGLSLTRPGSLPGLSPFAMTTWIGLLAPGLAMWGLRRSPRGPKVLAVLVLCATLSLGVGPIYDLPLFSSLRFPYRFHAGTLACLAFLAGWGAQQIRWGGWMAPLVVLEGMLLGPIEPILPGAEATVPEIYADLSGRVLLDLPGPTAFAPGQVNASRPYAQWFLFAQTRHGLATPWAPDFNSVGATGQEMGLESARALDPLSRRPVPRELGIPAWIDHVVVHPRALRGRADDADRLLIAEGWIRVAEDGDRWRYSRPD